MPPTFVGSQGQACTLSLAMGSARKGQRLHSEVNLFQLQAVNGSSTAKLSYILEPPTSYLILTDFSEINPVKVKWPKWEAKLKEINLEKWMNILKASLWMWLSISSGTKSLN